MCKCANVQKNVGEKLNGRWKVVNFVYGECMGLTWRVYVHQLILGVGWGNIDIGIKEVVGGVLLTGYVLNALVMVMVIMMVMVMEMEMVMMIMMGMVMVIMLVMVMVMVIVMVLAL